MGAKSARTTRFFGQQSGGDFLFPRLRSWKFGHPRHQNPRTERRTCEDFSVSPSFFLFACSESSDRAVAVGSASSAFLIITISAAAGAAFPCFSLRRLCLMWLRCVRRHERQVFLPGSKLSATGFCFLHDLHSRDSSLGEGVKLNRSSGFKSNRSSSKNRSSRGSFGAIGGNDEVHAESFESSGCPSACASADCMSQRCGSITARSRARPLSGMSVSTRIQLYDVPERKKSRWESISHARALEVVRVKPRGETGRA